MLQNAQENAVGFVSMTENVPEHKSGIIPHRIVDYTMIAHFLCISLQFLKFPGHFFAFRDIRWWILVLIIGLNCLMHTLEVSLILFSVDSYYFRLLNGSIGQSIALSVNSWHSIRFSAHGSL